MSGARNKRLPGELGAVRRGKVADVPPSVTAGPADLSIATGVLPSLASLPTIATDKLLGRDTAGTGSPEALAVSAGIEFSGAPGIRLADDGVTDAKLRNSGALTIIGRAANTAGDPADITVAAASDGVLRESGSTVGFGTVATGGLANDAVTDAKLRNGTALSVIGRSANSGGDPADIVVAAASDGVLRESGSVLGFGTIVAGGIATDAVIAAKIQNKAVTLAKMNDIATSSFIGRKTAATGVPEVLSAADALTVLGLINAGAAFYTGNGNPQGVQSAPIGNSYIDLASGIRYIKRGGGSTAYGWYACCEPAGGYFPVPWAAYPSPTAAGTQQVARTNHFGYFGTSIGEAVDGWTVTGVATQARVHVAGSNRFYASMTSGAVINTNNYVTLVTTNAAPFSLDDDADIWIDMRTGADITSIRIWFGLTNAVITDSDTFATGGQGALLQRYSTAAVDGGWIGQNSKNGAANHTESATLAVIAASTNYRLRIRFIRSTVTAYYSVNDGTEIAVATNTPPTGSSYFPTFGFTIKAASARTLLYRGWGGAFGSN